MKFFITVTRKLTTTVCKLQNIKFLLANSLLPVREQFSLDFAICRRSFELFLL